MINLSSKFAITLIVALFVATNLIANQVFADSSATQKGIIYFVFGSDSSTPGITIRNKEATYRDSGFDLFTSPSRNTAKIMAPSFRNRYVDSNGEPFRFTWWMQGGSLYRYADNTNIPYPSLMSLNLINRYFGDKILAYGDEFTYHYHTWVWSDTNNDGIYFWNQTPNYLDSQADFFKNLAEALIEEDMFPVSFRSGWHFMDNEWQSDLNDILPFSLHNAYPANVKDTLEPIDNLYVWNEAPADFVPFQPQDENYQLPGGNRGWNVRSKHFRSVNEALIREIFEAADQGSNQVPCIWSHVAEGTFIEDLENVFQIIERVAADYPDIEFRYDTAIEGMQRWLETTDKTPPTLSVSEIVVSGGYKVQVQTNEAIFQKSPFLAVKDVYEQHRVVTMKPIGLNSWESVETFNELNAASWSIAVSDSVGNQSKYHKDVLPDDIYIDNEDATFSTTGDWQEQPNTQIPLVWGRTAHSVNFSNTKVSASWQHSLDKGATYDTFIRFPDIALNLDEIAYEVKVNNTIVKSGTIQNPSVNRWVYLDTISTNDQDLVEISISKEAGETITQLVVDAVKLSAYRKPVFIQASKSVIDLTYLEKDKSHSFEIELGNKGYEAGFISSIESVNGYVVSQTDLPLQISSNSKRNIALTFLPTKFGLMTDTLHIHTSDPNQPLISVELKAIGKPYFTISDNDDSELYSEDGSWQNSVTQAFGSTSRYIFINEVNKNAKAQFTIEVEKEGWYIASFLVPSATNSAIRAKYALTVNDQEVFQTIKNQNGDITEWKWLEKAYLKPTDAIKLTVSFADFTDNGAVLRSDAVQLTYLGQELNEIIVDNDSNQYTENGDWSTSSAQSFGRSSRYTSSINASATYTINGIKPGLGELAILLPETVNASKSAQYTLSQGPQTLGQTTIDQNNGSGEWVTVGAFLAETELPISVTVREGEDKTSGFVLRADAIKWRFDAGGTLTDLPSDELPIEVTLKPNYPNPFNPTTTIRFALPTSSFAKLEVFNIQGQRVALLVNAKLNAGNYTYTFNAAQLSSGMYITRLTTAGKTLTQKMMLIK